MTKDQEKLFTDLENKITTIFEKYQSLKDEKESLYRQNKELERLLKEKEEEKTLIISQYNHLKTARQLIAISGSKEEGREKIRKIVREIDKCISLLNI